jgi:hypothetical protein
MAGPSEPKLVYQSGILGRSIFGPLLCMTCKAEGRLGIDSNPQTPGGT